jgi:excisionase family DNA binding protein
MKAYLNAAEVAKLLKVDRSTVTRWLNKGYFRGAMRPNTNYQWRIPLEAYDRFLKENKQNEDN